LEGESSVVRRAREGTQTRAVAGARRSRSSEIDDEEEKILREATQHLIRRHGGLFVATWIRKEVGEATPRWIITVTLRYPTGHEGDVGELLYDGHAFTFLTDPSLIDDRVRRIAADSEHMHKWNAYRVSTLPAREA
jgi:hypothetical protein